MCPNYSGRSREKSELYFRVLSTSIHIFGEFSKTNDAIYHSLYTSQKKREKKRLSIFLKASFYLFVLTYVVCTQINKSFYIKSEFYILKVGPTSFAFLK